MTSDTRDEHDGIFVYFQGHFSLGIVYAQIQQTMKSYFFVASTQLSMGPLICRSNMEFIRRTLPDHKHVIDVTLSLAFFAFFYHVLLLYWLTKNKQSKHFFFYDFPSRRP